MKKIIVMMAVAISLLTVSSSKAQLSINVGINIGSQPVWGPVGYDHVDYIICPILSLITTYQGINMCI